jgi:type I restriction enzyme S subunit
VDKMGNSLMLNELVDVVKGKKVKVIKQKTKNSVPYLLIDTLRGEEPKFFTEDKKYTEAEEKDILIVFDGANSGLVGTGLKGAVGSTVARLRPKKDIDTKYLTYFLSYNFSSLNRDIKGSAIPHIKPKKLLGLSLRYPSTEERQAIVQKIENQFTRLDQMIKTLKVVKYKLDIYRKAVLKTAFEGKFNSLKVSNFSKISNLIEDIKYGTSKKCNLDKKFTPVLRIPNITDGFIDSSKLKYCNFTAEEKEKLKLKEGDVLIIRSNGSLNLLGRSAIVTKEFANYCFAGYLIRLRLKSNLVLPKYLNYFFQSGYIRKQIEKKAKSTSGVHNINSKEISSMELIIYPIKEQKQIVQQIESRFSVIDKMEEIVDDSLLKAEQLRKSILKSAFEGKLIKVGA